MLDNDKRNMIGDASQPTSFDRINRRFMWPPTGKKMQVLNFIWLWSGIQVAQSTDVLSLAQLHDCLEANLKQVQWNHFAIDLGAGVCDDDPVFELFDRGWGGIMVDGDPRQNVKMTNRFPSPSIAKVTEFIETNTVVQPIKENVAMVNVRDWRHPDVLKIDIDPFGCIVMRSILKHMKPKIVVMEANVKFSPESAFALVPNVSAVNSGLLKPFDSERRVYLYGCPLSFQNDLLMSPHGYELSHLDWNNAVYVRKVFFSPMTLEAKCLKWQNIYAWDSEGYFDRPKREEMSYFNSKPELLRWRTSTSKINSIMELLSHTPLYAHRGLSFWLTRSPRELPVRFCINEEGQLNLTPCGSWRGQRQLL